MLRATAPANDSGYAFHLLGLLRNPYSQAVQEMFRKYWLSLDLFRPPSVSRPCCRKWFAESFQTDNTTEIYRYAQSLVLVNLILVKLISCLVISYHSEGVSSGKLVRHTILCLLHLPIPSRARFVKQ